METKNCVCQARKYSINRVVSGWMAGWNLPLGIIFHADWGAEQSCDKRNNSVSQGDATLMIVVGQDVGEGTSTKWAAYGNDMLHIHGVCSEAEGRSTITAMSKLCKGQTASKQKCHKTLMGAMRLLVLQLRLVFLLLSSGLTFTHMASHPHDS